MDFSSAFQFFSEYCGRNTAFVETGTGRGTSSLAASLICRCVATIEIRENIYKTAYSRLKGAGNLKIWCGDSATLLPEMIEFCRAYSPDSWVFWLDAHWEGACPIMHELKAIKEAKLQNCTILIDDVRLFYGSANAIKQFAVPAEMVIDFCGSNQWKIETTTRTKKHLNDVWVIKHE